MCLDLESTTAWSPPEEDEDDAPVLQVTSSSLRMYRLNGLGKLTPPPNCQLVVFYYCQLLSLPGLFTTTAWTSPEEDEDDAPVLQVTSPSHKMYQLDDFEMSTPPQNRQLIAESQRPR